MCDFSQRAECVPTFACESERGPFVREVEKRDERWSEVELLLIVGATENREMYVYKSVAESRYFAGGTKPHCGRGREGPCFSV